MFKKTMKFDDLEGNPTEQTFYFNYTKKEVGELIAFGQTLQFFDPAAKRLPLEEQMEMLTTPVEESGLTQSENNQMAYSIFSDLILDAYGEKGADNVTFVKNARTREYFMSHVAFTELIFEFLEKPALAAEFIEKCLPGRLVEEAKAEMQRENAGKLSSETLAEMAQEAERRQQDPATRIEPGMQAAIDAGVAQPGPVQLVAEEIVKTADDIQIQSVLEESTDLLAQAKAKPVEELTAEDFELFDKETVDRLVNSKKLPQAQLMMAFQRRTQL